MTGVSDQRQYWDDVALEWAHTRPDWLWRRHSDQVNAALLAKWLPEQPIHRLLKTDLFDEAVGEGLLSFLGLRARTVVGMDISNHTLRTTQQSRRDAICADVRQLPFASGSFDVVVSNSTLDHFGSLQETEMSLSELRRVLCPGGQLLLTLDNMANPLIALRNVLPFRWLHRMGVVPYYVGVSCGPTGLRRILERVGLEVAEMTAILHCPRVAAVWIARMVQARTAAPIHQKFLSWLMKWERLSTWPTRFLTGNYVAVRCTNRRV
jgi:SAM-dependent methyltransferase